MEHEVTSLTRQAIERVLARSPDALERVLARLLDLSPARLEELDALLEKVSFPSMVHTTSLVAERVAFLADLEGMLFDAESKKRLLERTQLHRILAAGRTWVFGEGYSLAVDDRGLTAVLAAHRHLLSDETPITKPVKDTAGRTRIVDLMLTKASLHAHHRQHLVVELKRPNVVLTQTELAQITNYAIAVMRDDRFLAPSISWEFWLVGDATDAVVEELTHRAGQPSGLYTAGPNYKVWVRRWAEILEENRQRLHFYCDHLRIAPSDGGDLDRHLSRYLSNARPETTGSDK